MRWVWRDANGPYVYDGCDACMRVGRLVHIGVVTGRRILLDMPCSRCSGLGYLTETRRQCDEDGPDDDAPSAEMLAARARMSSAGRCPDCLGYGRWVAAAEDERGRTVVVDRPVCTTCHGTGAHGRQA